MSKVHIIKCTVNSSGAEQQVALNTDVEPLKDIIRENPNIRLFIIDPVTNHLGNKRMHKEQDVREVLNKLCLDNVSTIIVCHLNKNSKLGAQQRSMGAAAFTGRARAAFLFGCDPEEREVLSSASPRNR